MSGHLLSEPGKLFEFALGNPFQHPIATQGVGQNLLVIEPMLHFFSLHLDARLVPFVDAHRLSQFHLTRQHNIKGPGLAHRLLLPVAVINHLVLVTNGTALLQHHVFHAIVSLGPYLPFPGKFIISPGSTG